MSLIISKKSVDAIVNFEVGSENLYNRRYTHPVLPGVNSGITIGIGYDLGMSSVSTIIKDWTGFVSNNDLALIKKAAGLTQTKAKEVLPLLKNVTVSYHDAEEVFIKDLSNYAAQALHIYPGLEKLNPDTVGAIISLVYNRGSLINDTDRRKEMKALVGFIAAADYINIAAQFRSMKRLWSSKTAQGLITRREVEALLVDGSQRVYSDVEKISI
ncbi:MAG: hypothetical protein ABIP51_16675 [Bacteroidia bacterium]